MHLVSVRARPPTLSFLTVIVQRPECCHPAPNTSLLPPFHRLASFLRLSWQQEMKLQEVFSPTPPHLLRQGRLGACLKVSSLSSVSQGSPNLSRHYSSDFQTSLSQLLKFCLTSKNILCTQLAWLSG